MDIGTEYLRDFAERVKSLRRSAERAAAQVDDEGFFAAPDAETNSIAINLKHVGGNLRSRFSDFLTTDGEKPGRDRDGEFIIAGGETRADVEAGWARGWRRWKPRSTRLRRTTCCAPSTSAARRTPSSAR